MAQQLLTESQEKTRHSTESREMHSAAAQTWQTTFPPIQHLQRILGNRGVTQLIQAKRLTIEGKIIDLQKKLTVGAGDDQYEQKADRVTRQIMNTPAAAVSLTLQRGMPAEEDQDKLLQTKPLVAFTTPYVQRVMAGDEEPVQAKPAESMAGSFDALTDVEIRLSQNKGHGSPLPDPVRTFMEPRFGADFSHVRVHTGSDGVRLNRAVGTQAFMHGSNIYFGAGHNPCNLEHTAHKLTHVIRQTDSPPLQTKKRLGEIAPSCPETSIQRKCSTCAAEDIEEKEAEPIAPQPKSTAQSSLSGKSSVTSNINGMQCGSVPLPRADKNFKDASLSSPPTHLALGVNMASRIEHTLHLQRQAGNAAAVELLRRCQNDERAVLRRENLQRDPKKKEKLVSQDFAVLLSPDKDFVTLATVIAPRAKILKATSVDDLAKQLKAIKGPIGTLYFVAHMTEDGDLMFTSPGTMTYVPAEIMASKIKDSAQVESIDFRGCSIAQAPAEMDKIRGALKASKATGSTCTLVTHSADPIKIGGKAITQPKDLTNKNKAAFDAGFKEIHKLFVDGKKKCIINDSVDGYFQTGGRLIAAWVNPGSMADSEGWDDTKSICYKDLKLEKVDPTKKLPVIGPDDCKLVEVGKK